MPRGCEISVKSPEFSGVSQKKPRREPFLVGAHLRIKMWPRDVVWSGREIPVEWHHVFAVSTDPSAIMTENESLVRLQTNGDDQLGAIYVRGDALAELASEIDRSLAELIAKWSHFAPKPNENQARRFSLSA